MSYVNSTLIKNACNLFYFSQLYMPNVSQKQIFLKLSSLQFVNKIFNRSQFWNKYHRDALYKKYAHFVSFKSPNHNRNISSFLENIIIFISILLKGKSGLVTSLKTHITLASFVRNIQMLDINLDTLLGRLNLLYTPSSLE